MLSRINTILPSLTKLPVNPRFFFENQNFQLIFPFSLEVRSILLYNIIKNCKVLNGVLFYQLSPKSTETICETSIMQFILRIHSGRKMAPVVTLTIVKLKPLQSKRRTCLLSLETEYNITIDPSNSIRHAETNLLNSQRIRPIFLVEQCHYARNAESDFTIII